MEANVTNALLILSNELLVNILNNPVVDNLFTKVNVLELRVNTLQYERQNENTKLLNQQIFNTSITDRLCPLVNTTTGNVIEGFPTTMAEFLALDDETINRIIQELGFRIHAQVMLERKRDWLRHKWI